MRKMKEQKHEIEEAIDLIYTLIIKPLELEIQKAKRFPDSASKDDAKVPYFNAVLSGFDHKDLLALIEDELFTNVSAEFIKQFSKKYSSGFSFSFYGDSHGEKFTSFKVGKNGNAIEVGYIVNWDFDYIPWRNATGFREIAEPNDCIELAYNGKKFFLNPLTAIQSAILIQKKEKGTPLTHIDAPLIKLEDIKIPLFINGIAAEYRNDACFASMSGEVNSTSTGRYTSTMDENCDYEERERSKKRVFNELDVMKKARNKVEIIEFFPTSFPKGTKLPRRLPSPYSTG